MAKRSVVCVLFPLLALLPACGSGGGSSSSGATAGAGGAQPVRRVLIIGIDGLRPDALEMARTPAIDGLIADGCYTAEAQASAHTWSGPGWTSMLTGTWPDKHRVIDNSFSVHQIATYPHVFARLQQARPGAFTASIVDWDPIDRYIVGATGASVRLSFPASPGGDDRVLQEAIDLVTNQDPDLAFVYFTDVDSRGHSFGFHPTVPEYMQEIEEVDGQIGQLLTAVRTRPSYPDEDWLIIVSTDHGGTIDGRHGRDEPDHRRIFFIASGPSAARGWIDQTVNQVDVAATALAHLGVAIDPAWELDGRPVGLRRTTPVGQNLLYNGDAELSPAYSDAFMNAGLAGWTDLGSMTSLRYDSPDYPSILDPGPPARGDRFFSGGDGVGARASQWIGISDLALDVDAGRLTYELSAWLGGWQGQEDRAYLEARFLDVLGRELLRAVVGPVTLADRQATLGGTGAQLTGLLPRSTTGPVPTGTRHIEVTLVATTVTGVNDGYADELSLVLRR